MKRLITLIPIALLSLATAQVNAPPAAQPPANQPPAATPPPTEQLPTVDPSVMGGLFEQMIATSGYHVIGTPQDVVTVYNVATDEILLAADAIVSEDVADAIRSAMVERGVSVYILTRKDTIDLPESYVQSLQQAGAKVRVTELSANFALIDRKNALMGAMAAGFPKVSVQPPVATIDPELAPGTDMLEYFYDTNTERRQMIEDAFAIISETAPTPEPREGEIEVEVEPVQGYNETPPTTEMYQACQEQLSSSSIASLLTNGSVEIGGPAQGQLEPVPEGGEATPAPLLADNACYEYAEPTGITTLVMEPTFVEQLIDGYYQAYELAEDYGG